MRFKMGTAMECLHTKDMPFFSKLLSLGRLLG